MQRNKGKVQNKEGTARLRDGEKKRKLTPVTKKTQPWVRGSWERNQEKAVPTLLFVALLVPNKGKKGNMETGEKEGKTTTTT